MNDRRVNYNIARSRTSRLADVFLDLGFWVAGTGWLAACQYAPTVPQTDAASQAASVRTEQQMNAVLDQLAALGGKPIESLSVEEARQQPTPADAVKALLKKQGKSHEPEPVAQVENRTIAGPGGPIQIRIYSPSGKSPCPVVVYYHGGGWVIGTIDTYEASARALANAANAIVVSVEYRKAPEHKFPAAHEDAYFAYTWVLNNAKTMNGDPAKVAVAGESAGGNMAAAVSLMARDRGTRLPVHQVLVYPVADHDMNTPSYREHEHAKPLNKAMMSWFFDKYMKSRDDVYNPLLSLLRAEILQGLPSATVITAEIDPLRAEGKRYADRLWVSRVPVTQKTYKGVTHEFFGMGAVVDEAKQAVQFAAEGLKKAFARESDDLGQPPIPLDSGKKGGRP